MDEDNADAVAPHDAAEYIGDLSGQLAAIAHHAGLMQTAALLLRAQASALADLRRLQPEKAAPDDAA
ncbi:MAG: hypothetical protein ACT4OF_08380 [Caulobacteraceae bacterium]